MVKRMGKRGGSEMVGACQKEPDGEQAQQISKIGKNLIIAGVVIVISLIILNIIIIAGTASMVRSFMP